MGPIRGNALASYLNIIRKSGKRAITPTKKSSQRNSFLTHKSYGYSEKCMRACVSVKWERRGRACENSHGTLWSRFVFFFFSLPLFELEIKDTTDTIKGPTII
jgi:hypothetical protein